MSVKDDERNNVLQKAIIQYIGRAEDEGNKDFAAAEISLEKKLAAADATSAADDGADGGDDTSGGGNEEGSDSESDGDGTTAAQLKGYRICTSLPPMGGEWVEVADQVWFKLYKDTHKKGERDRMVVMALAFAATVGAFPSSFF